MTEPDATTLADIRRRWEALLEKVEDQSPTAQALAISLWATLNVDILLNIAERRA